MGKYKKEIKHCEKCNKPFSVFPDSTETLCTSCKRDNLEETLRRNGHAPQHTLVRSPYDGLKEAFAVEDAQEGLRGTRTQASRKRAVTAAKHSRLLVQNAFSSNRITWHCLSVARLAVKRGKKRGRRTTDGSISNGLRSLRQR